MSWRVLRGKGNWLRGDMSVVELVTELLIAEFTAYCCTERKNKEDCGSERIPRAMGGVVMGDDQGDGGVHRRMGGGEEDSVDWLSFVARAVVCLLYTSPSPRD